MNGATDFLFIPYIYSATSSTLALSASTTVPLLLDQDADFELHEIICYSDKDYDGTLTPAGQTTIRPTFYFWQIADKTNGRLWSDAQLPEFIGARVPGGWRLYPPVLVARRSNLSITFTSVYDGNLICKMYLLGAKVLCYTSPGAR